ncbi:MAG TPA: alpha-amylase family glycosyl hydrolase [Kiritimatiellia bacterium]
MSRVEGKIPLIVLWVLLVPSLLAETYPAPLADTVLYSVFVRNYSETGTLKAVEERLPELEDLGANALWLMPLHPIGEVKRVGAEGSPYSVRDFRAVHSGLGSREDLASLAAAAHARGMKLLIDLVPDHCAWDNAYVAEHPDWFMKDEHGNPRPPIPAWGDVVQFDYGQPSVRAEMTSIMRYWPSQCGIDGYRVDVAGMVPGDFWRESIPALRASVTGLVMLAEATGREMHEQGFDLTYDMDLRNLLVQVCRGERPASDVAKHLEYVRDHYAPGALLMRYTENHDIDRTAAVFPGGSARAAAALVFSLPGVPMIYTGQEIGMARKPDLFGKDPVPWGNGDEDLRAFYKKLIQERRDQPSLRYGALAIVGNSSADRVLSFTRSLDGETTLAVFNLSDQAVVVTLDDPGTEHGEPVSLGPWAYSMLTR